MAMGGRSAVRTVSMFFRTLRTCVPGTGEMSERCFETRSRAIRHLSLSPFLVFSCGTTIFTWLSLSLRKNPCNWRTFQALREPKSLTSKSASSPDITGRSL
ncbi:hypothetical protein PAL_GLEAN10008967 [Pteropus alecto]|uniref:Uncharacterized protein n=1 Tax=Pteropus alecto TaxID=9402 RepID=L5KML6_PTEAL|nr:hypothetical protein PAL_GLEAN10008967 [Pteropus alecto]